MGHPEPSKFFQELIADPSKFQTRDGREIQVATIVKRDGEAVNVSAIKWTNRKHYPITVNVWYPRFGGNFCEISLTAEGRFRDNSLPMPYRDKDGKIKYKKIDYQSNLDIVRK